MEATARLYAADGVTDFVRKYTLASGRPCGAYKGPFYL